MKIKHSKFKNTGLIYELLVKQITADTLSSKESPAIGILKKYFTGKSSLVKEFKLYDFILHNKGVSSKKAEAILSTIVEISKRLDHISIKKQKYNLIKEIKTYYNIDEFFSFKVRDYKPLAGLYCLLESLRSTDLVDPLLMVNNKLTILEHLTSRPNELEDVKSKVIEEYENYPKDLKLLTYKLLLEKFNEKYDTLLVEQKNILREFINSMSSPTKLRNLINTETEKIKQRILENITKVDNIHRIKINEIVRNIVPIPNTDKVSDDALVNIMLYYDLVNELEIL